MGSVRVVGKVGLVAVLTVASAGCGNGETGPTTSGQSVVAAADTSGTGSAVTRCPDPGTVAIPGCEAVLVTFDEPIDRAGVLEMGQRLRGAPIAVWRDQPVCVRGPGSMPGATTMVASQFAYWNADLLMERRDQAPSPTDGGYSHALRDRFRDEWRQADDPDTTFTAAVYHAPAPSGDDGTIIKSYRTDGDGTLYLRGHDAALSARLAVADLAC